MNRLKNLLAFVAVALVASVASAQCGQQRVIDPTNAFLGSGVGVSVQGGGCANGQCNQGASVSTSASVSALQSQIRALNARIAGMQRTDVRVYAAPARIASYQAYDAGGGGGASASSSAGGSASSSASASAPRSTRALYVVPSAVYAMDDGGAAASASSSASASAAVDVAPSIALVPLNATDVQVAAGGCGGGSRVRILGGRRGGGRSRSRSVSVSVARN